MSILVMLGQLLRDCARDFVRGVHAANGAWHGVNVDPLTPLTKAQRAALERIDR